jgi:hypothetical protein
MNTAHRWLTPLVVTLLAASACGDTPELLSPPEMSASLSNAPTVLGSSVFDLATNPDGSLLAAETFVGVVELRKGGADLLAELTGVTGLAPNGRGNHLAITGGGFGPDHVARRMFRMSGGQIREVADLGEFEETVNPDQIWNTGEPDSNPYNMVGLGGGAALVADAAANAVLHVDTHGAVDWVAVLTPQLATTQPLKDFVGCPSGPADICFLPDAIPAQPVSTSVAVGPDGHIYVGELTGFPGTPGISRVWRVPAGSRHVVCPSASCTQALGGLTSIVDMAFGPDGMLYVLELDALGWLAIEIAGGAVAGGTVKACDVAAGTCAVVAAGLSLPLALTFDLEGVPWIAENASLGGAADIHPLP